MSSAEDPSLAGGFPPASREQWKTLAGSALARGGTVLPSDVDDALSTTTEDGIRVLPLYDRADASAATGEPGRRPFVRGSSADARNGWDVRALHRDPDAQRTNAAVLADLESGVTSLWLAVGEHGVAVADLPQALAGVYLELVSIVLDAGAQTDAATDALLRLADETRVPRAQVRGSLGADPIGARARWGSPVDLAELASLASRAAGSRLCAVTVDGTVYNDAGGSDSDELAVAASVGVAYVRALSDAGVDGPFSQLEFRYAVGDDQFTGIAKLRAARRIWSRIADLSGAGGGPGQRQHAVTSAAMMTRRDPWTNMLRTTIGCLAAAVGGAQAITVRPFDDALGLPTDLSRRMARNTQAVVSDEAHVGRVVDAAGGSWYVDTLTDQLAAAAWSTFTAIERAGGALAALESGFLGELVAASAAARRARIDTRALPITGVTTFADLDEPDPGPVRAPAVAPAGRLPVLRHASAFELLRDRSERFLAVRGARPTLALVTVEPAANYAARAGFARELFAVAGIETVVFDVNMSLGVVGPVVCLCASDSDHGSSPERASVDDERVGAAVSALRAAGVRRVLVAGPPNPWIAADDFVYPGIDALTVLGQTLDALAVPA